MIGRSGKTKIRADVNLFLVMICLRAKNSLPGDNADFLKKVWWVAVTGEVSTKRRIVWLASWSLLISLWYLLFVFCTANHILSSSSSLKYLLAHFLKLSNAGISYFTVIIPNILSSILIPCSSVGTSRKVSVFREWLLGELFGIASIRCQHLISMSDVERKSCETLGPVIGRQYTFLWLGNSAINTGGLANDVTTQCHEITRMTLICWVEWYSPWQKSFKGPGIKPREEGEAGKGNPGTKMRKRKRRNIWKREVRKEREKEGKTETFAAEGREGRTKIQGGENGEDQEGKGRRRRHLGM